MTDLTSTEAIGTPELSVSIDVSAVPSDPRGAGYYTLELVRALGRRGDVALHLIARTDDGDRWSKVAPAATVHAVAPKRRPLRLSWEQLRLPRLLRTIKPDVHHSPHYTMPESAHLPRVVTIHDLTFFSHPEWHEWTKVRVFRRAIRVAAKHADVLVSVSEATKDELERLCLPSVPVDVIPHGLDHHRFRLADEEIAARDKKALAELGLSSPYLGFVGTLEPRKDVPSLVLAFDSIADAHPDCELVLAGGDGWGIGAIDDAIENAQHRDRIRRLGYIDDSVVPAFLRGTSAIAYPSLEEGFGLPALEALACGTPLVTTRGSAMEEVVTGVAILVDPGDLDGLAGALDMALRGDAGSEERCANGIEVARSYTWEATAAAHVDVYRVARLSSAADAK